MKLGIRSCVPYIATVALSILVCIGCNRSPSGSPAVNTAGSVNNAGSANGGTATGSGAVTVNGNVLTYQNVHFEVPWDVSDVARLVRVSQEAASGAGLTLTDGKRTLVVASDGRSMRLDDHDCGALKEGDHVVLSSDGKLKVNDVERSTDSAAGDDGSVHLTVAAGTESTLTHGGNTLEILANGTAIRLNGRAYGAVRSGDQVVLKADGKLTVNDVERKP